MPSSVLRKLVGELSWHLHHIRTGTLGLKIHTWAWFLEFVLSFASTCRMQICKDTIVHLLLFSISNHTIPRLLLGMLQKSSTQSDVLNQQRCPPEASRGARSQSGDWRSAHGWERKVKANQCTVVGWILLGFASRHDAMSADKRLWVSSCPCTYFQQSPAFHWGSIGSRWGTPLDPRCYGELWEIWKGGGGS